MATAPVAPQPSAKPQPETPQQPPDESLWVRYTARNEFPISLAGSFFVHVFGVGLLALVIGGALAGLFGEDPPPDLGVIEIAGGGGHRDGVGDGKNTGVVPAGQEAVQTEVQSLNNPAKVDQVQEVEVKTPALENINRQEATQRVIQEGTAALGHLGQMSSLSKKISADIEGAIAGKGRGGPGEGGGSGFGKGPGTGNQEGTGTADLSSRQKRQLRWTIDFRSRNAREYLGQLQDLNVILAYRRDNGEYFVMRDLDKGAKAGAVEDVAKLNRIHWVGEGELSLEVLKILGVTENPDHLIVFMPLEIESTLYQLEMRAAKAQDASATEDRVKETHFEVARRGGRYEPALRSVQLRR